LHHFEALFKLDRTLKETERSDNKKRSVGRLKFNTNFSLVFQLQDFTKTSISQQPQGIRSSFLIHFEALLIKIKNARRNFNIE